MNQHDPALSEFLRRFADSWKTNDGSALGEYFVEDGTLINPFGERADGRDAICAMYSKYFGSLLAGTTTSISVESCRPVGADHVVVDASEPVHGPDGQVRLALHLTALLRRDGDDWKFVDARPYASAVAPG